MRMTIMSQGCAAAVALAMCAGPAGHAAAQPAYIGTWSTEAAYCGSHDPEAVINRAEFTRTGMVLFERICEARSISGGHGVWRVRYRCEVAGMIRNEDLTLWADANRLTVTYANQPGRELYVRCR
jgi:hypothetical protein